VSGKTVEVVPSTSADKLSLFRSLFRGRDDVFPTRFVSKRTGKPGYGSPARALSARPGMGGDAAGSVDTSPEMAGFGGPTPGGPLWPVRSAGGSTPGGQA